MNLPLWVCAATDSELAACPVDLPGVHRLVCGVGIPETFARLRLPPPGDATRPALLVNIGIAGAYPGTGIEIGDIVVANGEVYGDVGFELPDENGFRFIGASEWGAFYAEPQATVRPPALMRPTPPGASFRVHIARGCTVNACTGTKETGWLRARSFGASFESMEGAAVAQIGQQAGVPVCEIRAISNIAAQRDMRPENIRAALTNLAHYLETCDWQNAV